MNILKASKEKHLATIIDFQLLLALETEDLKLEKNIVKSGVESVFEDSSKGEYLVVESGETTIASLLTMSEWSDWRNKSVLWIHSVYVLPEYRGQGVFPKMYSFLKEKVEDSDQFAGLRLFVDKTNLKAQKVYNRIGMTDEHYNLFEWLK